MYYNNFFEDETVYIGRTEAYYNQDDDDLFYPDLWTWSNDPKDDDFAGEVYELNDDGKEFCLTKGQCLLLKAGPRHYGTKESEGVSFYWLHFRTENMLLPFLP